MFLCDGRLTNHSFKIDLLIMRLLFIFYLVLLHFLIGITLIKTDIVLRIQSRLGYNIKQVEITPFYYEMVEFHRRVDKNILDNSVIFLGDSLIQGVAVSAVVSPSVNFGIGADTTTGLIQRIPEYSSISRSKTVVIAIGINDLNRRDNKEIISNYKKIISLIPSNIKILFSAILPIDESTSITGLSNERIRSINIELEVLCSKSQRLYFLDITEQLTRADGQLSEEFHIGDGLHLNSSGNRIWISNLKEGLSEINPDYNGNTQE